jgi:hypothetical protein
MFPESSLALGMRPNRKKSVYSPPFKKHISRNKEQIIMLTSRFHIACIAFFCFIAPIILAAQTPEKGRFPSAISLTLSSAIHASAPFLAHEGTGAFDNYLSMNLPFAPAEALWKALEKQVNQPLKNRGEAHITVISPPEFSQVLGKVLTMKDINEIATNMAIQNARFTPLCLGRAQVSLEGKLEQSYFVVVRSEDLVNIRRAIFDRYVAKGGEASLWDPLHFYPHITIGFTKQDLHEEGNGVRKGINACFCETLER